MVDPDVIRVGMVVTDEDFRKLMAGLPMLSVPQLAALDAAVKARMATGPIVPSPSPTPPPELPAPAVMPSSAPAASIGSTTATIGKPDEGCASVADIEAWFATAPVCPHCRSDDNVIKWGSANRLRRYRCKACIVTFNALTETPLAQLHKRELWIGNAQALVDGISLRKVAVRLDVHVETAFRWRHRFLAEPKGVKAKTLTGTVEADE